MCDYNKFFTTEILPRVLTEAKALPGTTLWLRYILKNSAKMVLLQSCRVTENRVWGLKYAERNLQVSAVLR